MGLALLTGGGQAADWSTTELHLQRGRLDAPDFAGGGSADTTVVTLQHASGWQYGEQFVFIDYLDDDRADGFNDQDLYGELYASISLGAVSGRDLGAGPLTDVGLLGGVNFGADADVVKYLPGIRLSWSAPGFTFLNTDVTAYIDGSGGVRGGGAPAEDDSFMVDVNWAYPFSYRGHQFSIEGHVEYIGERTNELGEEVSWWILGQPQFRYDIGQSLLGSPERLYIGVEWQFWINKLGDAGTDENAPQLLAVWRL